jgi:hypothetical protein
MFKQWGRELAIAAIFLGMQAPAKAGDERML